MKDNQTEISRVAVGMSGGLDSSVVAALLKEQGHDVIGLTLHLFKEGSRCCSVRDVERSREVCAHLDIPHYVIHAVDLFEDTIIRPFVDEYRKGHTPSPCVLCNQFIKFGILQKRAVQLGCSHVATGHYVRVENIGGRWHLFRANDAKKDQSYFLHRLSQEQLSRCLFPLAGMKKTGVAVIAKDMNLPVDASSKVESQDLCFINDDGPGVFVEKYHPDLKNPGEIINDEGRVVGQHKGYHRYTVGQRKGLNVAAPDRLYVRDTDPESNQVFVTSRDAMMDSECDVADVHWVAEEPDESTFACEARIRYRQPSSPATVERLDGETIRLHFKDPQFAITPGQAAVFYRGDEVLGGGWIKNRIKESE